jgi:hypothetical protein
MVSNAAQVLKIEPRVQECSHFETAAPALIDSWVNPALSPRRKLSAMGDVGQGREWLTRTTSLAVLTGVGISGESGAPT